MDTETFWHVWTHHFLFSSSVIRTQPCKHTLSPSVPHLKRAWGCLKPVIHLPTLGNKSGTLPSGLFNTCFCTRLLHRDLTEHIWASTPDCKSYWRRCLKLVHGDSFLYDFANHCFTPHPSSGLDSWVTPSEWWRLGILCEAKAGQKK